MSVQRIYVEKKPDFAVKAKELREEIRKLSWDQYCHRRAGSDPV